MVEERDQRLEPEALILWQERMYEVVRYEQPVRGISSSSHDGRLWVRDIGTKAEIGMEDETYLNAKQTVAVKLWRASPWTELLDEDRKAIPSA